METNNSQAVIMLPSFTPDETKRVSMSLTNLMYHALLADDALETIGSEAIYDCFTLLKNSINAIPVCNE